MFWQDDIDTFFMVKKDSEALFNTNKPSTKLHLLDLPKATTHVVTPPFL